MAPIKIVIKKTIMIVLNMYLNRVIELHIKGETHFNIILKLNLVSV